MLKVGQITNHYINENSIMVAVIKRLKLLHSMNVSFSAEFKRVMEEFVDILKNEGFTDNEIKEVFIKPDI